MTARSGAELSSLVTGLGERARARPRLTTGLRDCEPQAGFDRYVELAPADAATLAKRAEFVSKSTSQRSRWLTNGTAGPGF